MPRLLWVAQGAPTREVASMFGQAGWQLLHLDASAGTVGWVRTLGHDAVLLHQQTCVTPLLRPLRHATSAPLLVLGMPADEAGQLAMYEQGVDAMLARDATPSLLLARLRALMRHNVPRAGTPALGAEAHMGRFDATVERLRARVDVMPAAQLRIGEVPGLGFPLRLRTG
jgi:DNA-binding response OmpR family regulator